MAHSIVENYLHIIFSTKYRSVPIHSSLEERLYSYIVGISKQKNVTILRINGTDDHIHILLKLHPSVALADLIRDYKSYSTAWIKKNGFPNFAWQIGYGGFSYCRSLLKSVMNYIDNQKEHHKTHSLRDEVEMLKKQWGIDWEWHPPEDQSP